jgi:3-oxoacyl-[acyl-carrier-protein] synthase II
MTDGTTMDITGWSAVSPYGLDTETFAAAVRARRPAMGWADPAGPPGMTARLVPGFDQRAVLGKKGTKGMDRLTGLAVTAVGELLAPGSARQETALVLGTSSGSAKSMMDFTRSSLTAERPFDVDPAAIPSVVMNCAAGQCAIWHGLAGPNTTIAGDRVAGLLGLAYARRLFRAGRAETVLCGAAEEYSAARSWLEFHTGHGVRPAWACGHGVRPAWACGHGVRDGHGVRALGEGAAMLRLEPAGAPGAVATVLAVDSRVGGERGHCRYEMKEILTFSGVPAGQVWAVVTGSGQERAGLDGMFAPDVLARIPPVAELIGDTGATSSVFAIAAALAACAAEPAPRTVVIATTDPGGTVATAVLRIHAKS